MSKLDNTTPPEDSNNNNDSQHPAQRDAARVKHHYPLSFLLRILSILLVLFLIVCIAIYIAAGTEKGTRFILDTVAKRTDIALEYGSGNIRDGLLLKDFELNASEGIEVKFINAYVQIGWRAIFAKEVHLRNADIEHIAVINHNPPTGEPFAYKDIELPINLRFDNAHIGLFSYNQQPKEPVIIHDIVANDLTWVGTKVSVDSANLQYADLANVTKLSGFIDLQGTYPLDIDATVTAKALDNLYVDPVDIQATGSLKRMYGLVNSTYNDADIKGTFEVQPLDASAPFNAKLVWEDAVLPYAQSQDIRLSDGVAVLSGVTSNIDLRISTELTAVSVPSGHYQGRASIRDSQMFLERLTVQTPNGDLNVQGVLDWQKDFTIKGLIKSQNYRLAALVPAEYADYAAYAPKVLDGQLAIVFDLKNEDGLMQIDADLQQRDGEHINAEIVKGVTPENARFSAPWEIDAAWLNYRRQDVPQIGDIDSPSGRAEVTVRDNRLWLNADAQIEELNAAPAGRYEVKLNKVNDLIIIENFDYNGLIGDLTGTGDIELARGDNPLKWQIDARTMGLRPQLYKADLPITHLVGDIDASGQMIDLSRTVNGQRVGGQRHSFTINSIDMTATLASQVNSSANQVGNTPNNQTQNNKAQSKQKATAVASASTENRVVSLTGSGAGKVTLINGELEDFSARFDGKLDTQGLPKGDLVIDVESAEGAAKNIIINRFSHKGEAGLLTASGRVNLTNGIDWNVSAQAKDFNAGFFMPQADATITGNLKTSGAWQDNGTKLGDLQDFNVKFDGAINTPRMPQGKLVIDAGGNANDINIRQLIYRGEAGSLNANGLVKVRDGINWNVSARAQDLDLGFFTPQTQAVVTGNLKTSGAWKDTGSGLGNLQHIDVNFDGSVDTPELPKGNLSIDAGGNANDIKIRKLQYSGEAGSLVANGLVTIRDAINWNLTAQAKGFNVGLFVPQTQAIVSGKLQTSGTWLNNTTKTSVTANSNRSKNGANENSGVAAQNALQNLRDITLKFNGTIDTPSLPKGQLVIDASGDANAITLRQFKHTGEAGSLLAKGTINLDGAIGWDISAAMDNFNLGYFVEDMPSSISGRITSNGVWGDTVQRVNIEQMSLRGQIKNEPLQATGSVHAVLHLPKDMGAYLDTLKTADANSKMNRFNDIIETLDVDDVILQWGDNRIVANGDANRLQTTVNISDLQQIYPSFTGRIEGGLTIVQSPDQHLPTIYVDISGTNIQLPNIVLREGVVKGKVTDLGKGQSDLVIVAKGLSAASTQVSDLVAAFKGTQRAHTLALKATAQSGDMPVGIQAELKGGLAADTASWSGVIGKGRVATPYVSLIQSQPAQIVVNWGGDSPQVRLAAHCWQATDQAGKLCLRRNLNASANNGQVDLAIQQLDTTLFAPFMPNDLTWNATISGKVDANWQQGRNPSVNATVYSDNGVIRMTPEDASPITMPYKRISLIATSVAQGLHLRTDIDNGNGASGYADIVLDPFTERKAISGDVILNEFNLAIVKPFFPGMRTLAGNITLDAKVNGTLSNPTINGEAKLTDASIAMLDLPINLSSVNATAKINGQRSTVSGTFMSGEGTGQLDGSIDWYQEVQAKFRIRGENLVVSQPPVLYAEVSPDINVIVRPNDKYVKIAGAVSIPNATIRPPEANEEVITKSQDVVVLDRRLIGNIDEVLAITQPWSINANIGVDLGDDVVFRGFGAVLPLAGALHITQQGQGVMKAEGVVQVSSRTEIDALGRQLELNYAQVRFDGDLNNPRLSIEAVTDVEDSTVGVRVKGRVTDPNITLFNDAGLTQQQAINALVTGRISAPSASQTSEQGFKSRVTNSLAAAGLNAGFQGTHGLTNSIGQAFGLQRLTLGASGTADDTNVNITGYITPDLYIRYGVGVFNAESVLSLRYQLTKRIYLEATSAIERTVDVVYSFQF